MKTSNWSEPQLLAQADVRVLRALSEVLVPLDAQDVPFGQVDLIGRIETHFEGENPVFLRGVKLSLWIVEMSPLFWGFGFHRFSGLPIEEREQCVERWEACRNWRLRNLFYSCKVLVLSNFYDDDAVSAAVGFRA